MKIKKISKTLALALISGILVANNIDITYAKPDTEAVEGEVDVNNENELENSILDALEDDEEADSDADEEMEAEDSSLLDGYEPIRTTVHDEVNTVQISLLCKMPQYFTLGVKMELLNLDTDEMYEIVATNANNYYGKLYVPAGSYTVASVMVDGDITDKYPMEYPEDFTVYDDSNHSIETTLVNYNEIQAEAYERLGLDENGNPKTEEDPDEYEETVYEEDTVTENNDLLPWRIVTHEGSGEGMASISGTANGNYDIVAEITTTGVGQTAEYRYSTDGGSTWSDVRIVSSEEISTTDGSDTSTGLKINFNSMDEYVQGDRYLYTSCYEYKTRSDGKMNGSGQIRIASSEIIYDAKYQLRVTITKTGACGKAMFKYNLNGVISEETLVPTDGTFEIPDTGITVTFWDAGGKFVVGDNWYVEIKGETGVKDYTPYIVGAIIIAISIVFAIFTYFTKLKDKPTDYVLKPYKRIEMEENQHKKKNGSRKKGKKDKSLDSESE